MSNTALIVLDFINGITENEPYQTYLEAHHTIEKANQLIAHARQNQQLIVFVKVGFSDSYVELAHHSPIFMHYQTNNRLKLSEKSTDFHAALDYQAGDTVVIKHRISAFYATALEAIFNANDIGHLILCGISTNFAVESTARDAHDRNYLVTIAEDACASNSEDNQAKSLSILSLLAQVKTVNDICKGN